MGKFSYNTARSTS